MSKKKKKPSPGSLLTRFIKGRSAKAINGTATKKRQAKLKTDKKPSQPAGSAEEAPEEKPKTGLDLAIREIKHMMTVGDKDPERLAMLVSKLLVSEQKRKEQDQEKFDQMVSDILEKDRDKGAAN